MDNENNRPHLSGWFWLDLAAALAVVLLGGLIVLTYSFLEIVYLLCMILVIAIPLCRKLYRTSNDEETFRTRKKPFIIVLRTVYYCAALSVFVIPMMMHCDIKQVYPVQRSIFISNNPACRSSIERILPEKLPEEVFRYNARFIPAVLQGEAGIEVSFFTDTDGIQQFSETAKSSGAQAVDFSPQKTLEGTDISDQAEYWLSIFNSKSISPKEPEVWLFGDHAPGAWLIDRESGFIYIYW